MFASFYQKYVVLPTILRSHRLQLITKKGPPQFHLISTAASFEQTADKESSAIAPLPIKILYGSQTGKFRIISILMISLHYFNKRLSL